MHRIVIAVLAFVAVPAAAQVTVKDPWVRATVAAQKVSGAFMQLSSPRDVRLVEARSPVAGAVEIHETRMEQGVARMRQAAGIDVAAGRGVELKPGGYHVMLLDLKRQLKEGESVPLTLVFEGKDKKRESVEVQAAVRPLASSAPAHGHKGH